LNFLYILAIALALALDAFTVAVGLSLGRTGLSRTQALRLAVSFGIFQSGMFLLGHGAGKTVLARIEAWDHWIAFGLLMFVGLKMIFEALRSQKGLDNKGSDPTKWAVLLLLSVATSIDALAVGLSLAVLDVAVLKPAVLIGGVAFVLSLVGAELGQFLESRVGKIAPAFGGIVLILIGVKILVEHI
jgi:putative Mn2+ efflux pump MntP